MIRRLIARHFGPESAYPHLAAESIRLVLEEREALCSGAARNLLTVGSNADPARESLESGHLAPGRGEPSPPSLPAAHPYITRIGGCA